MNTTTLYLVATENDGANDPLRSDGAIVFETYTKLATLEHALERAEQLGNRYGRTWILRAEVIGTVEELKAQAIKDEAQGLMPEPNTNSLF